MDKIFAVCARPKCDPSKTMILRRFDSRDDAVAHALRANMANWDDIWIEEATPYELAQAEAPLPWRGEFAANGHCYIIGANDMRVAYVYGNAERRRAIIDIVERLTAAAEQSEAA